jgi:hypothetical protein
MYEVISTAHCPGCLNIWENDGNKYNFKCKECGIGYYSNSPGLLFLTNFITTDDELSWDWEDYTCVYMDTQKETETQLPWLSYSVTKEQLKKTLIFI